MNNQTINKNVMVQHLIVKAGLEANKADEVVEILTDLMEQGLKKEGKVVFKNIGTIHLAVLAGKMTKSFGVKKKLPTRFKLKFTQSRNFIIKKSPLKNISITDEIGALAKESFFSK